MTLLRLSLATAAVALLCNCDMFDMPKKMDGLSTQMQSTNNAIHLQVLQGALNDMFDSKHTQYLSPPYGMMTGGKTFADNASENELMAEIDLLLKQIDGEQPDASLMVGGKWPDDVVASVDHDKTVKLFAVMIIGAFASQDMVNQVVNTEILSGGLYSDTASSFLEARSLGIHDIMLEGQLLTKPLDDPEKLTQAVDYAQDLDDIAALPFSSKLELKTSGMLSPSDNVDDTFDATQSVAIWAQIDSAFDTDLKAQFRIPAMKELRVRVQQACRVKGNWDSKKQQCSPTLMK